MSGERLARGDVKQIRAFLRSPWTTREMSPEQETKTLYRAKEYLQQRRDVLGKRLHKLKWAERVDQLAVLPASAAIAWFSSILYAVPVLIAGLALIASSRIYTWRATKRYIKDEASWKFMTTLHNMKARLMLLVFYIENERVLIEDASLLLGI